MAIIKEISLDLNKPQQFTQLTLQQGEAILRQIDVQILNNGDIYNIPTDAIVSIRAINSQGTKIDDECTVVDNKVRFTITQTMTSLAEKLPCQIKLLFPTTGDVAKTVRFHMLINPSVNVDEFMVTTGSYTQLDNALLKVDDWDKLFEEAYPNLDSIYATRLNGIDSQLADIVTYNLSSFCNDITKSLYFQEFMNNLDNSPKLLCIPRGKILKLKDYFYIPSNTIITGGGKISFEGEVTVNNLYNESLIANKNAADENIEFNKIEIVYNLLNVGYSMMRFKNVNGIDFRKCKLKILGNGTQNHNAIIDFWKGNTNVNVEHCLFDLDNAGSSSGGAIWMHNSKIDGYDSTDVETNTYNISKNVFKSNCGDEMVACFSSGGDITNVEVDGNTFIRLPSTKNICLVAIPLTSNAIDISNIKFRNNNFLISEESVSNKEVIRIGANGETISVNDFEVSNNVIVGTLDNSIAISSVGGVNQGNFKNNSIKNTGLKGTSIGISSNSIKTKIINNDFVNVNTPISKISKTIVEKNTADGVNLDGFTISEQNLATNGYIKYSNGLVQQWLECYLNVNNGAELAFTVPHGWTGGTVLSYACGVKSVSGATIDNKAISIRPSGVNQIILRNPNAQFVTVMVSMTIKV